MRIRNSKGFTLVELMIVVVILGILTAISVPLMKDYSERVRLTADKATLKVLNSVTSVYTRVYPYSGVLRMKT